MIRTIYNMFIVSFVGGKNGASLSEKPKAESYQERRWARRRSLMLRVNVCRDADLVQHSLATDFSLNGMFLRCHQVDFKVGDELTLAIPDQQDGTDKWYPMQVKVVRQGNSGVGLAFYHHDSHLFCSVNRLIHACSSQQKAGTSFQVSRPDHEAA
ncbi:PilZ domain-containing protein [Kaarinaea lacus]